MNVITQAFASNLGDLKLSSLSIANNVLNGFSFGLLTITSLLASVLASWQSHYEIQGFVHGKLVVGTWEENNKAAYEIRLLSKSSIFNRSGFCKASTIPLNFQRSLRGDIINRTR
ncbi:hypothetical protein NE237_008410 [Protea cynaroides]|uniref:Uncharacterized protein n=1 Tax=Protea cynaroides TaxID=273540 RepID=A0A9Q0KVR0_9MAGN|nr:hypothetical protein NE237_008410 [Protea cynaroides]